MAIDLETPLPDPEDGLVEDPRPGMRPPGQRELTGMYTVRLRCVRRIEADTPVAARDLLVAELRAAAAAEALLGLDADAVSIEAMADCVLDEPYSGDPLVELRVEMAQQHPLHFRPGLGRPPKAPTLELSFEPASTATTPPDEAEEPDDEPAAEPAAPSGVFEARYQLEVGCARPIWAVDEQGAEDVLREDVAALMTDESLDDWRDEVTLVLWDLERVVAVEAEPEDA